MIFKGVVFLSLLIVAYTDGRGRDTTDAPAHQACVQAPPATTYWTGWYSASDNFAGGSSEDFRHLCSNIEETQCREKYTHRSFDDTGIVPYVICNDGVLDCETPLQSCENAEVRLLCTNTNETLPEPDLHWSLSELDSGATMGANESWTCNDKVVRVDPIAGTMVGEVVLGERLRQSYGPSSHYDLCAVRTSYASLAFKPFVQNCLTNPDCCDSAHGISVMFWLQKNEMNGNESRSQSSPRHAFRSPSLVATVQNGHLIVTYLHLDTTWTVTQTLIDKEWVHVTITFDPLTNLTVYFNSEVKGQGIPTTTSQPFADILDEFEKDNTSFWVFSRDDVVTSSEIRPIMMTELKVFYSALSADLIRRIFQNEREDGPPKVLRMAISQKSFMDYEEQEEVNHIKLTCLIRAQNGSDLNVRFMYEDEQYGHFEELTSNEFFMTSYLQEQNEYRTTAVLYIFGKHDQTAGYLPSRFTCEVVSDSQLSAYGYPIIETYESTDLDETDDYYWTGFFNAGTPAGGDETETKDMHLAMAEKDETNSLCQNPIYADCRTAQDSDQQLWYEILPSFVPDVNYPCDGNGIRCSVDGDGHIQSGRQECPDLQVRYACPVTSATVPYSTSMSGIGKIDPSHTPTSGNNSKEPPVPGTPDTISGGVEDPMSTGRSDIDVPTTTRSSSVHEVTRDPVDGIGSPPESTTSPVSPSSSPPPDTRPDVSTAPVIVPSTRRAQDTSTSTTPDIVISTRRAQDTSTSTTLTIATIAPDTKSRTPVKQVQDTSTRTAPNDVSTTPDAPTTTRPSTKSKPDESSSPADDDALKTTTVALGDTSIVPSTMETSDDATVSSIPITAPPEGGKDSDKSTGNEDPITGKRYALTYLYPVMIVALGLGVPTLTACYYLCRKRTPAEIQEQRLIEDRKQKLAKQQEDNQP